MMYFTLFVGVAILFTIVFLKIMKGISKGGWIEIFYLFILLGIGMIMFLMGTLVGPVVIVLLYIIYLLFKSPISYFIYKRKHAYKKKEFEKELNKLIYMWNEDKTAFPLVIQIARLYIDNNFFDKGLNAIKDHIDEYEGVSKERLEFELNKLENIVNIRRKKYPYKCKHCGYYSQPSVRCIYCGEKTNYNIKDVVVYKLQNKYFALLLAIAVLISIPSFFPPGGFYIGVLTLLIYVSIVLSIIDWREI